MNRTRFLLLAGAVSTVLGACNETPVGATQFSVKVTKSEDSSKSIKVDFLWLIDNTPSMCQEQSSLASSLDSFLDRIEEFVSLDYRIGVITQDMLNEGFSGAFQAQKTTQFPYACAEEVVQPCLRPEDVAEDSKIKGMCANAACDCSNLGPKWSCTAQDSAKKNLNCNGTVNSNCVKQCTPGSVGDAECDAEFVSAEAGEACKADPTKCLYKCLNPSGTTQQTGCVRRPTTDTCPETGDLRDIVIAEAGGVCQNGDSCSDELPCSDGQDCTPPPVPWLTNKNAREYFKCLGIVGTVQKLEATYEQSLDAVYYALSEEQDAPNAEQARRFMREDAYLVVVIVTDEDDCSAGDCGWVEEVKGAETIRIFKCGAKVKKEQYGKCVCLEDTRHGGPLRPVSEAVNMVKSLKADPGRVLVAAIVGDSQASDPVQRDKDRAAFKASKCGKCEDPADSHNALSNTYICESATGKADFGSRYYDFVTSFGTNGIFTNICNDEGIGPALEKIANQIIRVFRKVCLDRPVGNEKTLVVRTVGPHGTCGDGSKCCTAQSSDCADTLLCPGGLACSPTRSVIQPGTDADSSTWQLTYSGDCGTAAGASDASKNAIIFNSVLPPGTGVQIDYEGGATQSTSSN